LRSAALIDLAACFARTARGRQAPGAEVEGVKGDAEEIGGDKSELGSADADEANQGLNGSGRFMLKRASCDSSLKGSEGSVANFSGVARE
jgi:hypothetical protein